MADPTPAPDPTPDFVALAAKVKLLSGDLDRRFEILSADLRGSVNQLNARIDALSTTRKVPLTFKPALSGDWLEGSTSPLLTSQHNAEAGGSMSVVPANLSRIGLFRASVRISDAALPGEGTLNIIFSRQDISGNSGEMVARLSLPVVPGTAEPQGDPIPGTEFVDNDRFTYLVEAVLLITGPAVLQPGKVVFESFDVDCIVA